MICAKLQNDVINEMYILDERGFARFELEMTFGVLSYFATHPGPLLTNHGMSLQNACTLTRL